MTYVHALVGAESRTPVIRKIGMTDIREALSRGMSDFLAMPTHAIFLCLIYPVIGLILARMVFGYDVLPLLFPLAAGLALVGPFAAIGFYELSRQRELGLAPSWQDAFDVLHSPSRGAIAALGALLLAIFLIWVVVAEAIYIANFGYQPAASMPNFARAILTTPAGWMLIIVGNGVGFLFALAVLMISVVSFPLLVDRDVGAVEAVLTSLRAVAANPVPMAILGIDRRRSPGDRRIAVFPRPRRRGPTSGPFDMAPLSQGRGARSGRAPRAPGSAQRPKALCGAISRGAVWRGGPTVARLRAGPHPNPPPRAGEG